MKRATAVAFTAVLLAAATARADDSTRGPAYLQGSVGISYWDFPDFVLGQGYSWTGFDPSFEFGFHFSGRHDGLVLGIRQSFSITQFGGNGFIGGHAAGTTAARGGYDIAFKAGAMEITLAPFATIGAGYVFDGPHAGLNMTGGLDVKLFLVKGFYVFARPAELGFQCLHDSGKCAFVYLAAAGAGFAFGN